MSFSAQTAAHAASHESQPGDLHIFEWRGKILAFDPVAVRVATLEREEELFLKACQKVKVAKAGVSLGWDARQISEVVNSLFGKRIFLTRRNAEAHPVVDRVEILVNASQVCNLACRYCFVGQGKFAYGSKRARRLLPRHAERLVKVLPRAFPQAKEFCIHFYGGEPLLNLPAIRAAVEAASSIPDSHVFFAITTNGTIGTREALALLRKGGFDVTLSIDGPSRVHDAVRITVSGKPTHARVIRFLNQIKNEGLFVRGSSVVRSGWSLHEAYAYLDSLPVDAIKAQAVRLQPGDELALTERDYEQYFEDLEEIATEVVESVRRQKYPKDDRFNHRVLQLIRGTRRVAFCGAGRWTFGLAADGTVLPCALLAGQDGTDLGNIDEPWQRWVEQGREWADAHGPRDECRSCWALPLCGGGCPAILSVCGEDECRLVRANCEQAIAIYASFLDQPSDLLTLAGVP